MEFFSSNDYELSYDKHSAHAAIDRLYDMLEKLERNRLYIIDDVSTLESHAHDVQNTSVDQDYLDFESILNEDGILNYELEVRNILDRIESAMNNYERITQSNYERKLEEENNVNTYYYSNW